MPFGLYVFLTPCISKSLLFSIYLRVALGIGGFLNGLFVFLTPCIFKSLLFSIYLRVALGVGGFLNLLLSSVAAAFYLNKVRFLCPASDLASEMFAGGKALILFFNKVPYYLSLVVSTLSHIMEFCLVQYKPTILILFVSKTVATL